MNKDKQKLAVAESAVEYVRSHVTTDLILGVGSGTTVDYFIKALAPLKNQLGPVVASSNVSTERLQQQGIQVSSLNDVYQVDLYVDGADMVDAELRMIKGGGAAHTREKVIAYTAKEFLCIADATKFCQSFSGKHSVPLEVIEMARSSVARTLTSKGAMPVYRQGVLTDNGHQLLDVSSLPFNEQTPAELENYLNGLPGTLANGLFAIRPADRLLLAERNGVTEKMAAGG